MITASIVLYHTPKAEVAAVLDCIEQSCIETVYIIDNSSNDYFRCLERQSGKIRYIYSENLGYGASHNIALREAMDTGAEFHLVLNPDIRFGPEVIPALVLYMRTHGDTAYMLPKVVYPDGTLQYLCKLLPTPFDLFFRRFVPNTRVTQKLNDKYVLRDSGYDKTINPPCLSGCFMFLRVETLKTHNLFFDGRFFMYCEDFDFIRRLHRVAKTVYYPEVSIIHAHAKESYKSKKAMFEHINSAIRYFGKWGWFFDGERKQMNKRILDEINYCCR